ncbi:MAG: methyltransferase domain-containing protein [Agrococcus casei]|uniref:methyltransferase domain-containing protein n=1 Tax=Agrococcus casei TaxID=343512 RepID=UPI003F90209C
MQCAYYSAGRCRSCTLLEVPYEQQLASKDARVREQLQGVAPNLEWLTPQASAEANFRNKAKLVVGGRTGLVSLGILDRQRRGIDLTGCELQEQPILAVLPSIAAWINEAGLTPYSVRERQGELKHVLLTVSPAGEFAMRLVLRSEGQLGRIRRALPQLLAAVPGLRVVSVNLQPEHKAVIEGAEETVLTDTRLLPMPLGAVTLQLGPRSFFQTNTQVTRALYARASEWIVDAVPAAMWDLYCGVGGFALHAAAAVLEAGSAAPDIVGVEVSDEAVASARAAAAAAGVDARFVAADAVQMQQLGEQVPDLVLVNPPRRGIGELAQWLEESGAARIVYSSCNPTTLARDIEAMPSMRAVRGQLFDMFPHTEHAEVLVELVRQ